MGAIRLAQPSANGSTGVRMKTATAHAVLDAAKNGAEVSARCITEALNATGDLARTTGIRTIDNLRDRCWINDITGCWHWRGALSKGTTPSMWLPMLRQHVGLATAICALTTGASPKPGQIWHCTCETRFCANPAHRMAGTRSSQMLACGLVRSPLARARMSAGRRAKSMLSDEAVADIRHGTSTLRAEAALHGISVGHVWRIRKGTTRNIIAAPGSSVFTLGSSR